MTCAEYQKVLPDIIDSGGNAEEEAHRQSCQVCSDLVAVLKYIAEQAKLLEPTMDPDPRVWDRIQSSLEGEGLVRPAGTARFPAPVVLMPRRWGLPARVAALAAALLIVIGLVTYRSVTNPSGTETAAVPAMHAPAATTKAAAIDDDDVKLLQEVAHRVPAVRASYEDSLKSVNAYIADAKTTLAKNPGSEEAHDHLMLAYDQKAMLYEMALSRSLE
ncbi:MAG: hypothetical protein LAN37_08680 [Acidobacteriia bacterium]|nr:hypothetical protein [Terriglobia bacterium]